jgi:hypothetical protein
MAEITEDNNITVEFTYPLPDAYLHTTTDLNKTGTWTYNGPDKLWVFVDSTTGNPNPGLVYTEKMDGMAIPTPPGQTKVFIDAANEPLIANMFYDMTALSGLPKTEETLPDGSKFVMTDPIPPGLTYDVEKMVYDVAQGAWQTPLPFLEPVIDWEFVRTTRNNMLERADTILMTKLLTDDQRSAMADYKQALRDLTDTFAGVDPWKINFPDLPEGVEE